MSGLQQHNETPTCAKQDLSKSSETSDVGKARIQLAFSQQSPTQHIDNNKSSTIIQNQPDKSSTMPYTQRTSRTKSYTYKSVKDSSALEPYVKCMVNGTVTKLITTNHSSQELFP